MEYIKDSNTKIESIDQIKTVRLANLGGRPIVYFVLDEGKELFTYLDSLEFKEIGQLKLK